jgi:16S rRNA (guanine527-N7)-methyltransferase
VPLNRGREPLPAHVRDTPALPAAYHDALAGGLADLRLTLDDAALAAIEGHVRLLLAWTRAINLTAIREPAAVALGHVVDSLTAVQRLRSLRVERMLDMGSGGGLPGVPLAAAIPSLQVDLLEPIAKKARFLATVIEATGLAPRVAVITARAEDLARDPGRRNAWRAVTARAVGSTAELVELAFPLLTEGGVLIAWKRGAIEEELVAARRAIDALGGGTLEVDDLHVPVLAGHRLVVATRTGSVPAAYPREPAVRRRRPW